MIELEKREKVITALECYTTNAPLQEQERENCDLCDSCDYYVAPDGLSYCDVLTMLEDALTLLKAQEPVKPRVVHSIGPTWWHVCGACFATIDTDDKF